MICTELFSLSKLYMLLLCFKQICIQLTMPVKGYIIFNKRLKVSTMFKHKVNNILPMIQVVAAVPLQLITECTEQAVSIRQTYPDIEQWPKNVNKSGADRVMVTQPTSLTGSQKNIIFFENHFCIIEDHFCIFFVNHRWIKCKINESQLHPKWFNVVTFLNIKAYLLFYILLELLLCKSNYFCTNAISVYSYVVLFDMQFIFYFLEDLECLRHPIWKEILTWLV